MGTPQAGSLFLQACVDCLDDDNQAQQFDTTALRGLTDITAEHGRITCRLPVAPAVRNRYGTLHGGCIATLVDTVGTAALVTMSRRSGVSLNINIDYLSPMPGGGDVVVDAKVVKVGKNIATINVQLRDQDTNKLVAQGTHVKFMADSEPEILEMVARHRGRKQPWSKL